MNYLEENENRFGYEILARGKAYAKKGLVEFLSRRHGEVEAKVYGTRAYTVHLSFNGKGHLKSATCDCPYAKEGHRCKHMVAVLASMEEVEDDFPSPKASIFAQKTVSNFKGSLQNIDCYDFQEYIAQAEKLYEEFAESFSDEQKLEAKEAILAESLYHGGYEDPEAFAEAAIRYLDEAESEYALAFGCRLYKKMPNTLAKAVFLHALLHDSPRENLLTELAENALISSPDWNAYLSTYPNENPFLSLPSSCFAPFARMCRFSSEALENFLSACLVKKESEALLATLSSNHLPVSSSLNKRLQSYFCESGNIDGYIAYMNEAIRHKNQNFESIAAFYHSLPEEKKAKEAIVLQRSFLYERETKDIALLTNSPTFSPADLSRISLSTILICEQELRAKGPSFYEKQLKKAVEKGLKPTRGYYSDTVLQSLQIIGRFHEVPGLLDLLDRDFVATNSFQEMETRAVYLTLLTAYKSPSALRRFESCI